MTDETNGFGIHLNTLHLFKIARVAYERAKDAGQGDLAEGLSDSVVALLFSAATLEAFIGEFAELSSLNGSEKLQRIAEILDNLEASRAQLGSKFMTLKLLLDGKGFKRDALPYQDFQLLLEARNYIMHMKPEQLAFEPHKIVRGFESRGLCSQSVNSWPKTIDSLPHVLRQISTPAAARWSCNVVVQMAQALRGALTGDDQHLHPLLAENTVT